MESECSLLCSQEASTGTCRQMQPVHTFPLCFRKMHSGIMVLYILILGFLRGDGKHKILN